ncbi:hypothetical protein CVT24_007776 [Panaeolus cyanescens]|uniref:Uncharacterized protein n=1 Tax=Panaeolus cyanescens TaxID=181874 RepID=A0A409YKW2_9AGAR|nr:hypothetical protein CVT24_007776 [Panaeolus cyanescens]
MTPYLTFLTLLTLLTTAHAAFNTPIQRGQDWVEQNSAGTWCYYPDALDPKRIDIACVGTKADMATVMQAHFNTTTSINYFSSSFQRYGGPEWPVDNTLGRVYICLTGRGGDGSYLTSCTITRTDNNYGGFTACKVEGQQQVVTDGCYEPNLPKPVNPGPTGRPSGGNRPSVGGGRGNNGNNFGSSPRSKAIHPGAYAAFFVASLAMFAL